MIEALGLLLVCFVLKFKQSGILKVALAELLPH